MQHHTVYVLKCYLCKKNIKMLTSLCQINTNQMH